MRRGLLGLVLFSVAIVATALPASAHAAFVSASPPPGTGLPQAPGAVTMRFSEPLSKGLSRIQILDRGGRDVGVGPTMSVSGDAMAMRRRLGLLAPGSYTVRWTTVSTLDGHTLQGSYRFGIGTAASADQEVEDSALESEGAVGLVGRFAALVGLALWAGTTMLGPRAARAGLASVRLAMLGRIAPALAFAGVTASALSSAAVATGSPGRVLDLLSASQSGQLRMGEILVSGAGFAVGGRWRGVSGWLVGAAIVAEAASGHAASSAAPFVATLSFGTHLAAVGVWVFAMTAALLTRPVRPVLGALSPYAIGAAFAVALSGVGNAALELTAPADLLDTGYGRTVLVKAGLIVVMAALGLTHNWLRRRASASDAAVARPVRIELAAALAALVAATVLVGTPNPPREAEATERAAGFDPVLADLAAFDALSLAEPSGPYIVGLTVFPPRPGPVEFRVTVEGVEAGDALRAARLHGVGPSRAGLDVPLEPCGLGCYSARGRLDERGEWSFRISARGNRAVVDATFTVPFPAPDGSAELSSVIQSMERLRSARLEEVLRGSVDGQPIVANYQFVAPDRFTIQVNERHQVVIGDRSYDRPDARSPWRQGPWPGSSFSWPTRYYREFWKGAAAVRLLGTASTDGMTTKVIAFVRPGLPAWFQLYVGADGVVRRQEMRAAGHIMDHTYRDLDAPLSIEPPI